MQNSLQCGQQSTTYILNMGLAGLFKMMVQGPMQTPPVESARCSPIISKRYWGPLNLELHQPEQLTDGGFFPPSHGTSELPLQAQFDSHGLLHLYHLISEVPLSEKPLLLLTNDPGWYCHFLGDLCFQSLLQSLFKVGCKHKPLFIMVSRVNAYIVWWINPAAAWPVLPALGLCVFLASGAEKDQHTSSLSCHHQKMSYSTACAGKRISSLGPKMEMDFPHWVEPKDPDIPTWCREYPTTAHPVLPSWNSASVPDEPLSSHGGVSSYIFWFVHRLPLPHYEFLKGKDHAWVTLQQI